MGGYGGIYGGFEEPIINLPPDNDTPSKPTVYFGCEIQVDPPNADPYNVLQVDAGYVWETRYTAPEGTTYPAGWGLFLWVDDSTGNHYNNIHPNGNAQRVPEHSLGSPHFGFSVRTGQVELSYPNPWGTEYLYYFRPINYLGQLTTSMTAKRVIGISQNAGVTCDGSSMSCRFFGGEVAEINRDSQGNISLVNRGNWPLSGTNFSLTPGRDDAGNFIVDFPASYTRTAAGNDPPLTQAQWAARCSEETVNINLKSGPAHIVGLDVTSSAG